MMRVAAVVVTFNRKVLLKECLDALLSQTRPLDKIILIDNASSDGTPEFLADCGYLENESIEYVRLPVNTGGAGGFYEGVKRAHEQGFDWIWVMDDDAEPKSDALDKMSYYFSLNVSAVCNLLTDINGKKESGYKHRGWFSFKIINDKVIDEICSDDVKLDFLEIEHCSFVGLAIRSSVIDIIGYPNPNFFIHYDDVEYCTRLSSVAPLILVTKSIVVHKEAAKIERPKNFSLFFGIKSARMPIDKLWITYYGTRNLIWLKRQKLGRILGVSYAMYWIMRKLLTILIYDDYKIKRTRFYVNAMFDGLRGVFDNEKPKIILGDF